MTTPVCPSYAGRRFPAVIISYTVWLYFLFPLSVSHVDELLAARGVTVRHETAPQWGLKFGRAFAGEVRCRLPAAVTNGIWTRSRSGLPVSRTCSPRRTHSPSS
jgi:putative transposase